MSACAVIASHCIPTPTDYFEIRRIFAQGVPIGWKLWFDKEKHGYTIRARSERYAVCTKSFNARRTVLYSVVDFEEGVRGTENLIFGCGAETDEQCREMLARIVAGETEISHRNRVPLKIAKVK